MSIASELNNYRNGLDDAWDAAEDMGATIPHDRNMVNLDDAIRTIPQSQGATYTVVWLDWDSVGTDLEILGTATGQFMDNYTSSATAVGSSFFAGAVSDNKQVIIRTGEGLPAPGRDWATETVRPVQVNYNGLGSATMYFWHETMFVRAQCPNSGTTWTFTKLSV